MANTGTHREEAQRLHQREISVTLRSLVAVRRTSVASPTTLYKSSTSACFELVSTIYQQLLQKGKINMHGIQETLLLRLSLDGTSVLLIVQLLSLAHIWSVLVKVNAPSWRNDRRYSREATASEAKCHHGCSWPAPFRFSPHSRHGSLCAYSGVPAACWLVVPTSGGGGSHTQRVA